MHEPLGIQQFASNRDHRLEQWGNAVGLPPGNCHDIQGDLMKLKMGWVFRVLAKEEGQKMASKGMCEIGYRMLKLLVRAFDPGSDGMDFQEFMRPYIEAAAVLYRTHGRTAVDPHIPTSEINPYLYQMLRRAGSKHVRSVELVTSCESVDLPKRRPKVEERFDPANTPTGRINAAVAEARKKAKKIAVPDQVPVAHTEAESAPDKPFWDPEEAIAVFAKTAKTTAHRLLEKAGVRVIENAPLDRCVKSALVEAGDTYVPTGKDDNAGFREHLLTLVHDEIVPAYESEAK